MCLLLSEMLRARNENTGAVSPACSTRGCSPNGHAHDQRAPAAGDRRVPSFACGRPARHEPCSVAVAMSLTREEHVPASADAGRDEPTVPPELCGLWRRVVLEAPGTPPDTTTRVWWLQTPTLYVDLRLPAARRGVPSCTTLDAASDDDLDTLAQQAGFAGQTWLDGTLCRWQRDIDFQPPSGVPDEGRLRIDDGWIVEDGVHASYREVWQREDDSVGDWIARRWTERPGKPDARVCYLVAGGDWFLFARARSGPPLEQAPSLAELLARRALDRAGRAALLDFEISLGHRESATPARTWRVELSTLPEREGEPLGPAAEG